MSKWTLKQERIKQLLAGYARSLGGITQSEKAREIYIHQDSLVKKLNKNCSDEEIESAISKMKFGDYSDFEYKLNSLK